MDPNNDALTAQVDDTLNSNGSDRVMYVPDLINGVSTVHASNSVKMYCLYMFHFCGLDRLQLAKNFCKHPSTIGRWLIRFKKSGNISREEQEQTFRRYGIMKRQWLVNLYLHTPILYLDEAKHLLDVHFDACISVSSVSIILHEFGMTYKSVERRAIQITTADVIRFSNKLQINDFPWLLQNLVFLDEVSFD
jgi:transposase